MLEIRDISCEIRILFAPENIDMMMRMFANGPDKTNVVAVIRQM